MKLKIAQERPAVVREACEKHRGLIWPLEILVFVAVFMLATLAELVIMVPGELLFLSQDAGYQAAVLAKDREAIRAAAERLASSELYMVLFLFSNIMIILIVFLFIRLAQKRRIATLGFCKKRMLSEYIKGMGIGLLLFSAAVLLCVLMGAIRIEGISSDFSLGVFLLFTVGFMIQGMAEEVLCRGYFLVSLGRRYSMAIAALISSLAFAALHLFNDGITPLAFLNLTLFGIFASLVFIRRGNIWMVGAIHTVWNLAQGNIYGIRVSGLNIRTTLFTSETVGQSMLLHGGTFGMEGGLIVSVVLIAAILAAYKYKTVEPEKLPSDEVSN